MKTKLAVVGGLALVIAVAYVVGYAFSKKMPDFAAKQEAQVIEQFIKTQHPNERVTTALRRIENAATSRHTFAAGALESLFVKQLHNAASVGETQLKALEDAATLLETQDITMKQVQTFVREHRDVFTTPQVSDAAP